MIDYCLFCILGRLTRGTTGSSMVIAVSEEGGVGISIHEDDRWLNVLNLVGVDGNVGVP